MDMNHNNSGNMPNNDPRKPGGPKPKGSMWTALIITLVLILLFSWILNMVSRSQYNETTFSDFMAARENGQLAEVEISGDRIIYMTKQDAARDPAAPKACFT